MNLRTNKLSYERTNKQAATPIFLEQVYQRISELKAKMVANQLPTEQLVRELMTNLHSSNLHYVTQETPFSLYVTVRKRLRETSLIRPPESKSLKEPTDYDIKDLEDGKKILENELKEKTLVCDKVRDTEKLLQVRLEKADDELLDKTIECDQFRDRNTFLQEKLEKAEADLLDKTLECNKNVFLLEKFEKVESKLLNTSKTAREEKDKIVEKNKFLITSVKRSTEETLAMEKKFDNAKKATKSKETEICSLKQKLEAMTQTNKKLEDDNNNHLSNVPQDFQSPKSNLRATSISSQTSNFVLTSDPHESKSLQQKPFQDSAAGSSKHGKPFPPFQKLEHMTDSDTKKPFPFPPHLHTTKHLPHFVDGHWGHGELFPPYSKDKNKADQTDDTSEDTMKVG